MALRFPSRLLSCGALLAAAAVAIVAAASGRPDPAVPPIQRAAGGDGEARPLLHVGSNAALLALREVSRPVVREGFAAPGDGGQPPNPYIHRASACERPDNGAEVPAADGGCWTTDVVGAPINWKVWGAVDDEATDNTAALVAAVAAVGAPAPGERPTGTILVPSSQKCFNLRTVSLPQSYYALVGPEGGHSCLQTTAATGHVLKIGTGESYYGQVDNPFYVTVKRIHFRSTVARTGGAYIEAQNTYHTIFEDIDCQGSYFDCIDLDNLPKQTVAYRSAERSNDLDHWLRHIVPTGTGRTVICLGCNGGGPINTFIEDSDLRFAKAGDGAGLEIRDAGGVLLDMNSFDGNTRCIWAHPGSAGAQVAFAVHISSTNYCDESSQQGILLDTGAGGHISDWETSHLWIGTCGIDFKTQAYSDYACLETRGTDDSLLHDNEFDVQIVASGGHGIRHASGTNNRFSGSMKNGGLAGAGFNGFTALNGVSRWSWDGRIGASSPAQGANNAYAYGVFIEKAGTDHYRLSGDLSGNRLGAINQVTGSDYDIDGVRPGVPWQTSYRPTIDCGPGRPPAADAAMRYQLSGKTVRFSLEIKAGSLATCRPVAVSLPFPAAAPATAVGRDLAGEGRTVTLLIPPAHADEGPQMATLQRSDATPAVGGGAHYVISGEYERR